MAFALLSALLFQFLLAMLSPDIEAMGDTLPRQGGARDPFEAVDISPRPPPQRFPRPKGFLRGGASTHRYLYNHQRRAQGQFREWKRDRVSYTRGERDRT